MGKSELGVVLGVLEDGLVSGDSLLEGGGLLVDGSGVGLDGGLVALVGGGSGSGGNTLSLIGSLISGLGGGVVGNGGFVLSGSSGIGLGSIFSEGVLGVEIGVSAVLGVGGTGAYKNFPTFERLENHLKLPENFVTSTGEGNLGSNK